MKFTATLAIGAVLASMVAITPAYAASSPLSQIKEKGVINVGVKTDYKPFGFYATDGSIQGFGPDLAKNVAEQLGVKLNLVPVQTANRIAYLQQGRIDLMIATMLVSPERLKVVTAIEPYYYGAGGNVIMPKAEAAKIKSWGDMKGKTVCGVQGALFNKPFQQKFGINVKAFAGTTEAESALQHGSCVGYLEDEILLALLLKDDPSGQWSNYTMPLQVEEIHPWAIAIQKSYAGSDYNQFLSKVVTNWITSDFLDKENTKWGLPANEYLEQQRAKLKK